MVKIGKWLRHRLASHPLQRARRVGRFLGVGLALGLVGLCAQATTPAHAQAWPSRQPIRVIVPFSAGSAVDVMARVVLNQVSRQIGQAFVIENRVGAGGTIGMGVVAKADPDGYTLLASSSAHTITPSTYAHLTYDTANDFAGIIPLGSLPNALVVSPDKYKTIQDLVAAAKAKPGALSYGSGGVGAVAHLNAERFRMAAGFEAVHVPYKGAPEALTDVMGGRVDFYFAPLSAALSLIRDGKVRALAVSSPQRSGALPDVPTTLEAGYPNSDYTFWAGLCAPAATPRPIIDQLHDQIAKALALPEVRDHMAKLGADPMPMTPAEFDAYLRREIKTNADIVKAAGIKPN